jgi:hypothetical protein
MLSGQMPQYRSWTRLAIRQTNREHRQGLGAKAKLEHTRIESRNAGMLESIFSICQGKCADGKMKSFK